MLLLEELENRNLLAPLLLIACGNSIPDFTDFERVLTGQYDPMLSSWGIGPQQNMGIIHVADPGITSNDQLTAFITNELNSGAASPNEDIIVLEPNNYMPQYGGYHTSFFYNGQQVHDAVVWKDYPGQTFDQWTLKISHEQAEILGNEAGAGEICDPVEGNPALHVGGYVFAPFVQGPGQQSPPPPQPPPLMQEFPPLWNFFNDVEAAYTDYFALQFDADTGNVPEALHDWQQLLADVGRVEADLLW